MAELWTLANAIVSLRRRLSDSANDKYRHFMDVDPDPDGVHRVFAVADSRLVDDTLKVYIDGEENTPDAADIDLLKGTFEIDAPDEGADIKASYYFQWFTDSELEEFLTQALRLLTFDSVTDTTIPAGLRTAILSFAAYYAYMKKAAEAAAVINASSAGFTSDNSEEHPNWMNLAKMALEAAKEELETFNETPVGANRPAMRFVAYRLPRYVPRS